MNKRVKATHGEYEVPTERAHPIFMGDAHHRGAVVWRDIEEDRYWFACASSQTCRCSDRTLLLEGGFKTGFDPIPAGIPEASNFDDPLGIWFVGLAEDAEPKEIRRWMEEQDLRVLWDSEDET